MISSTVSEPDPSRSAAANSSARYARSYSERDASASATAWLDALLGAAPSSYVVIACGRHADAVGACAGEGRRSAHLSRGHSGVGCARLDVVDRLDRGGAHPRQAADRRGAGEEAEHEEVKMIRGARAQLVDGRVHRAHGDVLCTWPLSDAASDQCGYGACPSRGDGL